MAGLNTVPAIILPLDDRQIAEISLIENLQRDDLNALEEAEGISRLMEQFELTQEDAAQRLGRSRPSVTNALRLLQLCPEVQAMVRNGTLSAGHARALAAIKEQALQRELAQMVVDQGISVRELEEYMRKLKNPPPEKKASPQPSNPEFSELEDKLMQALGTRVIVKGNLDKGRIILEYFQRDDLERIYEIAVQLTANSAPSPR
jgi:ParB family chromosome partitioning protein